MNVEIIDDQPPEVIAMLQALYSRSPKSVLIHLEQVRRRGPEKFMAQYYVGYGHKSIGDCGFTAMFLEQISILAAKAVQDTPLYCGQEASTRYLDMTQQAVLNPLGTPEGKAIQDRWMEIYASVLEELVPGLKLQFPLAGEDPVVWEKAIKARAFDIARSLLVGGVTTLVAWTANLRQADDHLKEMRHHLLPEVVDLANDTHSKLLAKYPSSFGHKRNQAEEDYIARSMGAFAYYTGEASPDFQFTDRLDHEGLAAYHYLLEERPPRTELHQRFRQFGSIDFRFKLDFGSYRDLQRHRSATQDMPLLTMNHGFHPWYIDQLPSWVPGAIEDQARAVRALRVNDLTRQYYIPIGFLVPVRMSCSLPSAVYIAELRSGTTVHPTLRHRAQQMGEAIMACVPGIAMHHDTSPGSWNVKRGTQDIVQKETA